MRRSRTRFLMSIASRFAPALGLTFAVGVIGCSGEPLPPPLKPAPSVIPLSVLPAPMPPTFRLPDTVVPRKLSATLMVVPTESVFRGSVQIDLAIMKPSRVIWLSATGLDVSRSYLDMNGARREARVVTGGPDFAGFVFEEEVPAGAGRLTVEYTGYVWETEQRGIFTEEVQDHRYIFTHFESVAARRAFPCFDEPSFKIPWQLTLRVRPSDTALSNTPVAEEKLDPDGFKSVRFRETKPLPSYLVAFAVGPFEIVDGGNGGKNRISIRFATPKGWATTAASPKAMAAKMLDIVEDELGTPYPYEKLDFVLVPVLTEGLAMENAGLIAVDVDNVTPKNAGDYMAARIMAHEIAHQWLGDLVTMAWWDDLWLNEGFATWMEGKVVQRYDPAFRADLEGVFDASRVMGTDRSLAARKVRQKVFSNAEVANAFDRITYDKGSAVLGTFEAWLGEKAFQKGISLYLDRFAFKNATTDDLLTALGEGSGKDIKAAFSTFLDQSGVPLVESKLVCDAQGAKLALSQQRFLQLGAAPPADGATWQIPVCVRHGSGKSVGRTCTLLASKTAELPLPALPEQKSACPEWVLPKADGAGYYRLAHTPAQIATLFDKGKTMLTLGERASAVLDVKALVREARYPLGDALALVPALLQDSSPRIQSSAVGMVLWLADEPVDADLRENVKRFVNKVLAPKARALGWQTKPDDPEEIRDLRRALFAATIQLGDDAKLQAEATALAEKWIQGDVEIDSDSIHGVLHAAAFRGDEKLWNRITARLVTERSVRRKWHLLRMLASFREPKLVNAALGMFLNSAMDPRMSVVLLKEQVADNRRIVWDFVQESFVALLAKIPAKSRDWLIDGPAGFCDEARRLEVETFFKARVDKVPGGQAALTDTLETISRCIARREAHKESLRAFLKKQ